jgi:site-specific recombinase XerD
MRWATRKRLCAPQVEDDATDLDKIGREQLQTFLEDRVAAGLSASVVSHLPWDLRAIFQLAVEDGLVERNPATSLLS